MKRSEQQRRREGGEPLAERLYRRVLEGAPPDFVAEYGDEMADAFRQRRRDAGGPVSRFRITVRELKALRATCRQLTNGTTRRERMGMMQGSLWQDVRFGARTLRRRPGFAALAILTLALGIGGTTAIFTVVNGVLLRPLPYPAPDQLVRIYPQDLDRGLDRTAFSVPDFRDWERESRQSSSMALYSVWPTPLTDADSEDPVEIELAFVTGGFFSTLGQAPALGRFLTPDEEYGDNRVVVLSHGLWERRYGRDPGIVGRTISLAYEPSRVVGVAGEDFAFPSESADAWTFISTIPQSSIPTEQRYVRFASGLARLAEGSSPDLLAEELTRIAADLEQTFPQSNTGIRRALVVPLHESMVGNVAGTLWVLLGAVGFILLIACVNVASLILARASGREVEMAVRSALGAPRTRVVRQLLVEGAILAALGAVVGLGVARAGVTFLMARSADILPRSTEVAMDAGVLGFTVLLVGLTVVLFGLFPALAAARVELAGTLREGGRDGGPTRLGRAMPRLLIAAEVALSLTLLVGSGLLLRSLTNLQRVDPGFEPDGALAVTLTISPTQHPDFLAVQRQYLDRLARVPGVTAVGTIKTLPLAGEGERVPYAVPGVLNPEPGQEPFASLQMVSPGLFRALGIPVLAGRAIDERDGPDSEMAFVVSKSFADLYFPGGDAVGRTLRIPGPDPTPVPIVGVVGDVRQTALDDPPTPTLYVSVEQVGRVGMSFVIRTDTPNPLSLAGQIRAEMQAVDPDQPIRRLETLEQAVSASLAQPRFFAIALALFSAVATALAAVGVYSVISYHVSQRTPELGLRMALGAGAGSVTRQALAIGMVPALAGIVVGLVGAALMSRALESLLFGIGHVDAVTYTVVGAGLAAVAFVACWIPARRAGRIDPARILAA